VVIIPIRATGIVGLLLLAAGVSALGAQATNQVGLPVGTVPEAVTLEDLDGNAVDLASYIGGGPVVFEFWATWCPVCAKLAPELDRAYERFKDRASFVVIAVGINQSPRSVRRHLEDHPMPFPVLWDGRGRAVRAYKAPTTSYVAILDAEGKVAYTGVGEDQKLEAALETILESGS
jgi:thiol-disulfide isomerase/thioredoxin